MIAPTILSVFLHGLIALVHNRPGDGYMSAYLLNDDQHSAYLLFDINGSSRCNDEKVGFDNTDCFSVGSVCFCYIGDPVSMTFYPTSSPASGTIPRHGSARPMLKSDAADFSWLVKMADVDGDAGQAKIFDQVSDYVLADLSFGWQRALTCELDQVQDEECDGKGPCEYKIYPNRFQASLSSSTGHVQALAEGVVFDVSFPNDSVGLRIKNRNDGRVINLYLGCANGKCPGLEIDNDPIDSMESMFEDVGSHFLSYYKLAVGENLKKKFPVRLREDAVPLSVGTSPLSTCFNIREDHYRKVLAGQAALDARRKDLVKLYGDSVPEGIQTRIICPMALFEN